MGRHAAKQGDTVMTKGLHDLHLIVTSGGTSLVPHPFDGRLGQNLSPNVRIEGRRAATVGSMASSTSPHRPQGGSFSVSPTNHAKVERGSGTVRINGRSAVRAGDPATSCNDAGQIGHASILATGKIRIGS